MKIKILKSKLVAFLLYKELELYVIRGESHRKITYRRGIGKTRALVKLSSKYNIPLVTFSSRSAEYIRTNYGKFNPIVLSAKDEYKFRGERFPIILIDEEQNISTDIINRCIVPSAKTIISICTYKKQ